MERKQEDTKLDRKRFTEVLCETLLAVLGEEYYTELSEVRKNNGVMKEVLYVRKKENECMPCFYTDELYASYRNGENEVGLAEQMVNIVLNECEIVRREARKFLTKEWMTEHLFLRLVHREKNRDWLEEAVYFPYLDLAAVVYVLTGDDASGVKSFLLPKSVWDSLELGDVGECFPMLVESTARWFPDKLWEIEQVAREGAEEVYQLFSLTEVSRERMRNDLLHVLSNRRKINGAAVMLYSGVLEQIHKGFSGNFFVIPSSIHEVLLVKETRDADEAFFNSMVRTVNESQVEPEEILSDHVYYYSAEKGLCRNKKE